MWAQLYSYYKCSYYATDPIMSVEQTNCLVLTLPGICYLKFRATFVQPHILISLEIVFLYITKMKIILYNYAKLNLLFQCQKIRHEYFLLLL